LAAAGSGRGGWVWGWWVGGGWYGGRVGKARLWRIGVAARRCGGVGEESMCSVWGRSVPSCGGGGGVVSGRESALWGESAGVGCPVECGSEADAIGVARVWDEPLPPGVG